MGRERTPPLTPDQSRRSGKMTPSVNAVNLYNTQRKMTPRIKEKGRDHQNSLGFENPGNGKGGDRWEITKRVQ